MFEVGFTELLVIFVLALVVLGPEKLPRLAAQVGRWIGRARAMAKQFREQLEEEVNVADMNKWQQNSSQSSSSGTQSSAAAEPPPQPAPSTPEQPMAAGTPESPEAPSSGHNSGPPPEPEASVYSPPAYASQGVQSNGTEPHPQPTPSQETAASPEERPARPGDVITHTHERGI